jgi:hypothetical protein
MMSPPQSAGWCQVVNGDKLPSASGGSEELCKALERAVAAKGSKDRFSVRVRVEPRSILSAEVTLADGRTLPALHLAEMDRPITKDTFDRFGRAIVDHAAGGAR